MLLKSCKASVRFLFFLIRELRNLFLGLDIFLTEDKDAFQIAVVHEVVIDEILIVDEHVIVVSSFAVGPDYTFITLGNGMSNRGFTCAVIAIEEVDKGESINRDVCKSCSVERDIRNCRRDLTLHSIHHPVSNLEVHS